LPEIERRRADGKHVAAAIAKPEIYEALEEHGMVYAIASENPAWEVTEILLRPRRPSRKILCA
jgi:hypothetical protein